MKITFSAKKPQDTGADIYIGAASKGAAVKGANNEYMKKTFGALKNGMKALYAGAGAEKDLNPEKIRRLSGFASREAAAFGAKKICMQPWSGEKNSVRAQIEGAALALYKYDAPREKKEKSETELIFCGRPSDKGLFEEVKITVEAVFDTRAMMNMPGNTATPSYIAAKAKSFAKPKSLNVKVLSFAEAKKMGMGAFCGVAQGSEEPAKIVVMEYMKGKKGENPVVFIGKGITFDSGGISLKPQASPLSKIEDMRFDMSGAAVVIHFMRAIAKLGIKKNVVAITPLTENLPDGRAFKPGDVVRSMSGKTVEIISTDAEGRLVLADAITYARKKYNPAAIVDIATLTGACSIALGKEAAGLMGNAPLLINKVKEAAEETGERVWELPLWEEYLEAMKTPNADLKNAASGEAGTITAGMFLKEFAGTTPWAHVDIAGTAYNIRNKSYMPDGVSAIGVRLFLSLIKKL